MYTNIFYVCVYVHQCITNHTLTHSHIHTFSIPPGPNTNTIKTSTKANTENPALMFKHDGHLTGKALTSCHPLHFLNWWDTSHLSGGTERQFAELTAHIALERNCLALSAREPGSIGAYRIQRKTSDHSGTVVVKPTRVGSGTESQILWKSSTYYYLLSGLSSPSGLLFRIKMIIA